MKVIADLCLVPLGVGVSVSKHVAVCEKILSDAGLKIRMHAYGTNIEGEWDEVCGCFTSVVVKNRNLVMPVYGWKLEAGCMALVPFSYLAFGVWSFLCIRLLNNDGHKKDRKQKLVQTVTKLQIVFAEMIVSEGVPSQL